MSLLIKYSQLRGLYVYPRCPPLQLQFSTYIMCQPTVWGRLFALGWFIYVVICDLPMVRRTWSGVKNSIVLWIVVEHSLPRIFLASWQHCLGHENDSLFFLLLFFLFVRSCFNNDYLLLDHPVWKTNPGSRSVDKTKRWADIVLRLWRWNRIMGDFWIRFRSTSNTLVTRIGVSERVFRQTRIPIVLQHALSLL